MDGSAVEICAPGASQEPGLGSATQRLDKNAAEAGFGTNQLAESATRRRRCRSVCTCGQEQPRQGSLSYQAAKAQRWTWNRCELQTHKIVCCARGDGNPESCVHPGGGVTRGMAKGSGMIGRRGMRSLRTLAVRTLRLVGPPACPSRLSANSSTQLAGGGKKPWRNCTRRCEAPRAWRPRADEKHDEGGTPRNGKQWEAEDPRRDRQAYKNTPAGVGHRRSARCLYCKNSVEGSSDRAQKGTSKCGREVQIGLAVCETGLVESTASIGGLNKQIISVG